MTQVAIRRADIHPEAEDGEKNRVESERLQLQYQTDKRDLLLINF